MKIKALSAAGYSRSDIAGFLEKGYQHVSNVLAQGALAETQKGRAVAEAKAEYSAEAAVFEPFGVFDIDSSCRITLSPALLRAIDGKPGGRVPWSYENGELKLMNIESAMLSLHELTRDLRQDPNFGSDALIAERRAEFQREERKFAVKRDGNE